MSETGTNELIVSWAEVEACMPTLTKVDGGFTSARRGLVRLPSGEQVFVKVAADENTREWAQKEVQTYRFLGRHDYPYAPKLLALNDDETGFALESLSGELGWDWSDNWTTERLDRTLGAMDTLASLTPEDAEAEHIATKTIFEYDDGWQSLVGSVETQKVLIDKLRAADQAKLASSLNFVELANRSARYLFNNDVLVHNDVRGDNCAWNPHSQEVKLVDWNWAGLGDKNIDVNALLVSVQKSGFDVTQDYAGRLDAGALQWLAGFWLHQAATPIWADGPAHLREFQLQSGIIALNLVDKA